MSDQFSEITSRSWFSRIGRAFSGILFGIILVLLAMAGLFWNEGRAVSTARALSEGAGRVVTIDPARPAATAGQLVHFTGPVAIQGAPVDPLFSALPVPDNANQLKRKVEMYQWLEEPAQRDPDEAGWRRGNGDHLFLCAGMGVTPCQFSRVQAAGGPCQPGHAGGRQPLRGKGGHGRPDRHSGRPAGGSRR